MKSITTIPAASPVTNAEAWVLLGMTGKFQGHSETVINAPAETIWAVLADSTRLPEWMGFVKHTTGQGEQLGAERSCKVDFEGRVGRVRERCVLFQPVARIGWEMIEDDLGFSRMFKHYGFAFELFPLSAESTRVVNTGFCNPRNIFVSCLNWLFLKRKAAAIRAMALAGLKQAAERGRG